jgi:hypothetical protein
LSRSADIKGAAAPSNGVEDDDAILIVRATTLARVGVRGEK